MSEVSLFPHDLQAERAFLGALLNGDESASQFIQDKRVSLSPLDFFEQRHGWIYAAITEQVKQDAPLELLHIDRYLTEQDQLVTIGSISYTQQLAEQFTETNHLKHNAKIIKSMAIRRKLINDYKAVAELAWSESDFESKVNALLDDLKQSVNVVRPKLFIMKEDEEIVNETPPTDWLWEGYIPYGEISAFGGVEGTGKTAFLHDLARLAIRGEPFPTGDTAHLKTKKIVFMDAESFQKGWAQRVRCWNKAGLWTYRQGIHFVPYPKGYKNLIDLAQPEQQDELYELMRQLRPSWLILDSWHAALIKATFDEQVYNVIRFLQAMATELEMAVSTVVHFNKKETAGNPYRIPSSGDMKGAGATSYLFRATFGLYRFKVGDEEDLANDPRICKPFRISEARSTPKVAFTFDGLETGGFKVTYHDSDLLEVERERNMAESEQAKRPGVIETTEEWIIAYLQENGPTPQKKLQQVGKANGFGLRAIQTSCKKLKYDGRVTNTIGKGRPGNKLCLCEGDRLEFG